MFSKPPSVNIIQTAVVRIVVCSDDPSLFVFGNSAVEPKAPLQDS